MITLAIDSAGKTAGVALMRDGSLLYECCLNNGLTHSQTLLPLVEDALSAAGVTVGQIGLFAVNAGPGSFTGLRIGMALVKGLAMPGRTPCAAVSSLEAAASSLYLPDGAAVLCAADARRGEIYGAVFLKEKDGLRRLCPDSAGRPEMLEPVLRDACSRIFVVGDGARLCYNSLGGKIALEQVPSPWDLPRACGTAIAGIRIAGRGGAGDAASLRPAYLRLSQAQRERAERAAAAAPDPVSGAPDRNERPNGQNNLKE